MTTNMPNAPLVYTLGIIRFPRVPDLKRFGDKFHDLIRSTYPLFDSFPLVVTNASVGTDGMMRIEHEESTMFQFASPDLKWAALLSDGILALHTVDYLDHKDFIERFKHNLKALLNVSEIGIEWMQGIGLRYINLIVPEDGEQLHEYLENWVLPPKAPDIGEIRQGMYVAVYETAAGNLRFQSLRNPTTTIPLDLDMPLIQRNGWKHELPSGEFAVMDIDHSYAFEPAVQIDLEVIGSKMLELRTISKGLFDKTGTIHAKKVWSGNN